MMQHEENPHDNCTARCECFSSQTPIASMSAVAMATGEQGTRFVEKEEEEGHKD